MNLLHFFGAWLSFGGGDKKITIEPHAVERTKELKGRPNAKEAYNAAKTGKLISQGNGVYKAVDDKSRDNVNIVCILVAIPAGIAGGALGYSMAGLEGMRIGVGFGGGVPVFFRIVTTYFRRKGNKV